MVNSHGLTPIAPDVIALLNGADLRAQVAQDREDAAVVGLVWGSPSLSRMFADVFFHGSAGDDERVGDAGV